MELKERIDRLQNELSELFEKCLSLQNFIRFNSAFKDLEKEMQRLMKIQLKHMINYLSILRKRIKIMKRKL